MIRYAFVCQAGHAFDSWFRDSTLCDRQMAAHELACPHCGSAKVEKAIMAPSIGQAGRESEPAAPVRQPVALLSEREQEARRLLKELREHVTKNADYVGEKFPDMARQMHREEIEHRSIYGEAKPDEVRDLVEEGVEVQPLPVLPDERN
ncbi:MAG TPA: DUF1178 family protein [Xanthobacteraceae bacterium]|nr:DUF1178 family protein [Xanthobacteraceae bacterium]